VYARLVLAATLVSLLLILASPARANQYEPVGTAGNWTFYRNNAAKPFVNYFAPLAIGLKDTSGKAAVVTASRPNPGALRPGPYSVRTGQFYLDFYLAVNGLISDAWHTPVSFWPSDDATTTYASRLPIVSGIMMEKLGFDRDGLFDSAKTMVTMPVALTRELGNQLGASDSVVARFFNLSGAREELTFEAEGFGEAMDLLNEGCDLINQRFGD
jgi:hypothetical protein